MQLYIHVPFCRQKCHYCGFYSEALGFSAPLLPSPLSDTRHYQDTTQNSLKDIGINLFTAKKEALPQDLITDILNKKHAGATTEEMADSITSLSSLLSTKQQEIPKNHAKKKQKSLNSSQAFGKHPTGVLSLADVLKSKKNTHITEKSSVHATGPTLADALLPKEQAKDLRNSFGLPDIDTIVDEFHNKKPLTLAELLMPQKKTKQNLSQNSAQNNTSQANQSNVSKQSLQSMRSLIAGDSTGFVDMETANEFVRSSLKGQNIATLSSNTTAMPVPRALPQSYNEENPLEKTPLYQLWKKTLLAELKIILEHYSTSFQNEPITSIFFGGGTPSLIPVRDMSLILRHIIKNFHVTHNAEISMESNPESITLEKAKAYWHIGFNRISLGVQSFQDENLQNLGRVHTAMDAVKAFHILREARFNNISIDLMWGLPNQKNKNWRSDIKEAINLAPEHISCYGLSIDEGSHFSELEEKGELLLPDEKEQALMYKTTVQLLEDAGYLQYEVSNFAKIGYQCRHNMGYWQGANYLGLGPSAASTVANNRRTHASDIISWAKDVQHGALEKDIMSSASGKDIFFEEDNLPKAPISSISPPTHDTKQVKKQAKLEIQNFSSQKNNSEIRPVQNTPALHIPDRPFFTKELLSKEDILLECIMLRLRTTKGLAFSEYKKLSNRSFLTDHKELIQSLMQKNLLRMNKGHVFLSSQGMLISTSILERFFEDTKKILRKF